MSVNGGVSNLFGGITNMHGTLRGMSNGIVGMLGYGSNQWWLQTNFMASTSADGWTNLAGGLSTNGASAWAQGQTDAVGIKGTLDGMSAGALSIGSGLSDPGGVDNFIIHTGVSLRSGSVPDFNISFLNPAGSALLRQNFGFLGNLMLTAWTYILYLSYAYWIAKTIRAAAQDLFAARGVTVQPMDLEALGFGGNAAGAMIWGFVIVAVLVVWAAALAVIFSTAVAGEDWAAIITHLTGDPFASASGPGAVAVHWVYKTFPLKLAVSLLAARMVWRFTMIYVVSATRFAMRFLPGS
jgi:hypothetical protein